jgi:hypothetical protein
MGYIYMGYIHLTRTIHITKLYKWISQLINGVIIMFIPIYNPNLWISQLGFIPKFGM